MKVLRVIVSRNVSLFFKDKGMLFTSLITPLILLVLYATFLADVYRDAFLAAMPIVRPLSDALSRAVDGCVGGQLLSSLLAVSCITVAFCCNLLSVQDKVTGARRDLTVAPVQPTLLALSYYVSTALVGWMVCLVALVAGLAYLATVGFYLSLVDVLLLLLDVLLLVLLGTALSSIVTHFLSSQGQMSAVGTIVSSGYGFICGAYMPISSFGKGLQTVLSFLPGTYATALLRNHAMRGAMAEMQALGVPADAIDAMGRAVDYHLKFFDHAVSPAAMLAVLCGSVIVLTLVFLAIHFKHKKSVH